MKAPQMRVSGAKDAGEARENDGEPARTALRSNFNEKGRQLKGIDRNEIVAAAFVLLNEKGMNGLNMRALAKLLDVQAPALYWHIESKEELLSMMMAEISMSAFHSTPPCADWREWLKLYARAKLDSLLCHRDGAIIYSVARPPKGWESGIETQLAPLLQFGFDRGTALSYIANITAFAVGWAQQQQNEPLQSALSKKVDLDKAFALGLESMVAGFADPAATNAAQQPLARAAQ